MSISIDELYWNSILSGFSYGDQMSGNATLNSEVTNNFNDIQYVDTYTGFQCTILEKKQEAVTGTSTLPSVTIAFRGTEKALEDYASDAIGVVTGVVENQIVSMYNYLSRVFAKTSDIVNQYIYIPMVGLTLSGTQYGLGLVPEGATVNFTGHSLGGHLAVAASRLFSDRTNQVYTYNALGFQSAALNILGTVDSFFNLFPTGSASAFPVSKIHDITSDGYPKGASSRLLFPMPSDCDSVSIPIERADVASTLGHSIDNLEESLSVYKLLSSLDPSLTMEQMRSIILSATYNANGKLEATVDSLRAAANGGAVTPTATGRESLLSAISNDPLLQLLPAGGLNIISIANLNTSDLASLASQEPTVFLALQRLLPIALGGYTPSTESSDAAALALWQQDRAGTLEGLNFTSEYLADKAKMLSGILTLAKIDLNPNTDAASSTDYHDRSTGKKLGACLEHINPQVTFGTSATDVLTGSSKVDHLYGGAGDDITQSRKGCFRFLLKQPFRRKMGVWGALPPAGSRGSAPGRRRPCSYSSTAPCAALLTRAA